MTFNSFTRNGWGLRHVISMVVLTALGVIVTFEAWSDIFYIAHRDEEASHIFLVPIVFTWLVWVRRERLRQCAPVGQYLGPVLVAIGWVISYVGFGHAIQSFWHGGAILITIGCFFTVVGAEVAWRFFPAFLALVFLVPIPGMARQSIAIPLQTVTADVTQAILEVLWVPVSRSGNVLLINGATVGIAEACNGLRMVFALALVSFAFAFGTPLTMYTRLIVLAASPISAILCNVVRLVPTVWVYGYTTVEIGDNFHSISGWFMLVIAFLALMGLIYLLRWALIPVTRYSLAFD